MYPVRTPSKFNSIKSFSSLKISQDTKALKNINLPKELAIGKDPNQQLEFSIITLSENQKISIYGISPNQLSADNFILYEDHKDHLEPNFQMPKIEEVAILV